MDEQVQEQTQEESTPETQETQIPELRAGTCTKDECRCLHEYDLIEVVDANGTHYQMTPEHAMNELAKAESIKQALGVK